MESSGVLDIFPKNPVKMRMLLVKNTVRYKPDSFMDLLVTLLFLEGSNQREPEEATMILWANIVQLIGSKSVMKINIIILFVAYTNIGGRAVT